MKEGVSIAMTTYNGEKYLKKQLDSILSQSYKNFELVICDDCSSDNTWEILNTYKVIDSRIKVFRNESNLGFKKNFEKSISLCSCELIALSDQDDIWLENHLEVLLKNIEGKSMSSGNTNIIDSEDKILPHDSYTKRYGYSVLQDNISMLYFILMNKSPCQGASSLYRKKLLQKALPIPEGVKFHDAWFSACACCVSGIGFTFTTITNYRLHGFNVSGKHEERKFINRLKRVFTNKKNDSDRLVYCEELKSKFPEMKSEVKHVIEDAYKWHVNKQKLNRWKNIPLLISKYKKIYATNSYKLLLPRILVSLIKAS